jgi:hypothetical protein
MLCKDGRLFHIDFGFIMGRDPKPFPPPMKLCREMVEAMGGAESEHYVQFRTYCCEAYNILRKSANLILSLFHLMVCPLAKHHAWGDCELHRMNWMESDCVLLICVCRRGQIYLT